MEYEICEKHCWDYDHFARKSDRERARLIAFQRIKGLVRGYQGNEQVLKKAEVTLEEWLEFTEDVREMKLNFAKTIK